MGILNVTPDSFSDGGDHLDPGRAVAAAWAMADAGADLLDIGAESTRPGSAGVPAAQQVARLRPVLTRLAVERFPLPITVDTTLSDVAAEAISAGGEAVQGINDVSAGLADARMLSTVARAGMGGVGYIAMHMQGTPATMQLNPIYRDVVAEVADFLAGRLAAARDAGIDPALLAADPGIGFGKALEHNLLLLRHLPDLRSHLGVPLLVGTSRKGFLGKITGKADAKDRLLATAASVAWAAANGADLVRVHDVAEMRDVVRVIAAIRGA